MNVELPIHSDMSRFTNKITKTDSCWLWNGPTSPTGYGTINWKDNSGKWRKAYAHRLSYVLHKGEIPIGLEIDHLCRVRNCVNPDHLEAVTPSINIRRGNGTAGNNSRKTHCKRGHPLSGDNLITGKKYRQCLACQRGAYTKELVSQGKCRSCRGSLDGNIKCTSCRDKHNLSRRIRRRLGLIA